MLMMFSESREQVEETWRGGDMHWNEEEQRSIAAIKKEKQAEK